MIHKFSTGPPNDHSCKVTIQLAWWFLTTRFLKFKPMRTHYGPWQSCWISNQHQKHKSGREPSSEHFWQVWFNSVQWFQRRFKCEKLTNGRRTLSHDKSSPGLWPGKLKTEGPKQDSQNLGVRLEAQVSLYCSPDINKPSQECLHAEYI